MNCKPPHGAAEAVAVGDDVAVAVGLVVAVGEDVVAVGDVVAEAVGEGEGAGALEQPLNKGEIVKIRISTMAPESNNQFLFCMAFSFSSVRIYQTRVHA
jgi:hypothetical protein